MGEAIPDALLLKRRAAQVLSITGKTGSEAGTVCRAVINDYLQYSVGRDRYMSHIGPHQSVLMSLAPPLFTPPNQPRADGGSTNTTPGARCQTIMSQMFNKRIGNLQLYQILADALIYARASGL